MDINDIRNITAFFFEELLFSDEESEDEDNVRGAITLRPRVKYYIEEVVDNYTEDEFRQNFRMFRVTFNWVLSKIQHKISTNVIDRGRHTITAKTQLLIALWYFGTPDSYRSICGRFNIGKATALRTVRRVALAVYVIAPEIIAWPQGEYLETVRQGFEDMGFPNTIGCVDGSYVKIPMPKENGLSYICRKHFAAVILQGVCDHTLKFTHSYAGEAGSCHDARVLKKSELWTYINDEAREMFPGDTHLIGDKAYPCLPQLLTPYKDNGFLTPLQRNFNRLLSASRCTIERAFNLLEKRFRRLKDILEVKKLEWVPIYIIACCVLHNICILQNDIIDIDFNEENNENEVILEPVLEEVIRERLIMGRNKRNRICAELGRV